MDADDTYDIPPAELRATQIEAVNDVFQTRVKQIRLLANRAETGGITAIRGLADLPPLLFAHTSYKSYPENWLTEGKWDRLARWLDTVSANRVQGVNSRDVRDIDDWIERLADRNHFLSCSSGTTGKISLINSSAVDRLLCKRIVAKTFEWATGIRPANDRNIFTLNPRSNNFKSIDTTQGLMEAYGAASGDYRFQAQSTIGAISRMVALRRNIAEGTALPGDITAFETTTAEREQLMNEAVLQAAHNLVAKRREKAVVIGQFPLLHRVSQLIREMGFSGKDFHPDNALLVGGGLKGVSLPPDYREYVCETLSIPQTNIYHLYSMQEVTTHMPRCAASRYHVPPWLVLLPLDRDGETLLEPPTSGKLEGRAAFFDLAVDGRWGGVISGDKILVDYGKCACGHQGPTINADILRYKDLPGGDYITCAGTIDAYVRGIS
jgi:hypothetical protein